jgi:hypothetical protein
MRKPKVKSNLPNMKVINQLKATLMAKPETYNQDTYVPTQEENVCGSAFCIAGHAYLLAGHTVKQLVKADAERICRVARETMGLPSAITDTMFGSVDAWPDAFIPALSATAKQRAAKACQYLDAAVDAAKLVEAMEKNPIVAQLVAEARYS